jgi:hypothetical protein
MPDGIRDVQEHELCYRLPRHRPDNRRSRHLAAIHMSQQWVFRVILTFVGPDAASFGSVAR